MAITSYTPNPKAQTTTLLQNGMTFDVNGTNFPLQQGIPIGPIYTFKVVPVPKNTICITSAQSMTAPGFMTLNSSYTVGVADTNINGDSGYLNNYISSTVKELNGNSIIYLDCERAPSYTITGGTTTNSTDVKIILTGVDYRGQPATRSVTIAANTIVGTYNFTSEILGIQYVYIDGAISTGESQISIGSSDIIGLPYFVPDVSYILQISRSQTPAYASSDWYFSYGQGWRNSPVAPPNSTSPTRGLIDGGVTGMNMDFGGGVVLRTTFFVYGADSEISNGLLNVNLNLSNPNDTYGLSNLVQVGVNVTETNTLAYPFLTSQDVTGISYASSSLTNVDNFSTTAPDMIFYQNYRNYILNN